MHILYHLIISFLFALGVFVCFKKYLHHSFWVIILIITLSGIIIDLDHVAYYGSKYGFDGINEALKDFRDHTHHFYFMHTVEFLILIGVIAYFYRLFILVWAGICLHLSLDFATHLSYNIGWAWLKYYSWISYFFFR